MQYKLTDCQRFRKGYPGITDGNGMNNVKFYSGDIKCVPNGDYIDIIHRKWVTNYDLLEKHHGYIQWLFPIREHGMNSDSQPLTLAERDIIRADDNIRQKFITSFKMMLGFYGMVLDEHHGEISRSNNWKDRFFNLRSFSHNNLRISRILKALSEFGFPELQAPLVKFLGYEILGTRALHTQSLHSSLKNFFVNCVIDEDERLGLILYFKNEYAVDCSEPGDILPETVLDRIVNISIGPRLSDNESEQNECKGTKRPGSSEATNQKKCKSIFDYFNKKLF